jgi:hypothetical protein
VIKAVWQVAPELCDWNAFLATTVPFQRAEAFLKQVGSLHAVSDYPPVVQFLSPGSMVVSPAADLNAALLATLCAYFPNMPSKFDGHDAAELRTRQLAQELDRASVVSMIDPIAVSSLLLRITQHAADLSERRLRAEAAHANWIALERKLHSFVRQVRHCIYVGGSMQRTACSARHAAQDIRHAQHLPASLWSASCALVRQGAAAPPSPARAPITRTPPPAAEWSSRETL